MGKFMLKDENKGVIWGVIKNDEMERSGMRLELREMRTERGES